nr:MAG: hypothetical protein [Bacteriophage sp.]
MTVDGEWIPKAFLNPFMNGLKMCALIQVPISLNDCTTPFLKPSQVNFPASVKCFIIYFLASATAFLKIPPINAAKPPNAAPIVSKTLSAIPLQSMFTIRSFALL